MAPFIPRLTPRDPEKLASRQGRGSHDSPVFDQPSLLRSSYGGEQKAVYGDSPSHLNGPRAPSPYEADQESSQGVHRMGFWSHKDNDNHYEEDENWDEEPRQSPMTYAFAISILVILSVSGWFLYRWISPKPYAQPPVINPEGEIYKIHPDNPGGLIIPHQDKLVYGRLTSSHSPEAVEHLLPPPEEPMMLEEGAEYPIMDPSMSEVGQEDDFVVSGEEQDGQFSQPFNAPEEQDFSLQEGGNPDISLPYEQEDDLKVPKEGAEEKSQNHEKKQRVPDEGAENFKEKQQKRQNDRVSEPEDLRPISASQKIDAIDTLPKKLQSIHTLKEKKEEPEDLDFSDLDALIQKEMQQKKLTSPSSANKSSKDAVKALPQAQERGKQVLKKNLIVADSGRFILQVASLASLESAEKELKRLQRGEPSLFKDKSLTIQRIDGEQKTTYRLIVGPFQSANQADHFNKSLKNLKVNGMIMSTPQ